ncbi:MAG: glycosyltransferase family 4 protein [Chloroflexi bacterium]|nr:glycosyltransferase family 4 protein [Chloroflexota bacterium]
MKIAIDGRYIQDHFPGIARVTYNLVANLAPLVDEELTLLYNPALANSRYDLAALEKLGKIRLRRVDEPTFSLAEQIRIPALLARLGIEVFHSTYYVKPYLQKSSSVVSVHDVIMKLFPEDTPSRKAQLLYDLAMRLSLRTAKKVITGSQFSKEGVIEYFGTNPEKISVIYDAVDSRFQPREVGARRDVPWHAGARPAVPLPAEVRERLSLPRRFALYVGINKPHKNLSRLIEALAHVRREIDLDLVIAGKEDKRYPGARITAEKLGVLDHVKFLGGVAEEDLPALYNLADLFAFPSLSEGFGLPALEAMASGTPVVCSRGSSLTEVVGDAGLLFDPYAVGEIAGAIKLVASDADLRARLSARGIQRASQFTWEKTAGQTLAVYREALA